VVASLRRLSRPETEGVRWSTEDQWHITLRFLGRVDDPQPVIDVLGAIDRPPAAVEVGPATARLGSGALIVPVSGLEELAADVHAVTAPAVPITEHRPFRGHLTVARARTNRKVPKSLEGTPFEASWTATSFTLVRSQTEPTGAVYEDIAAFDLAPG
jgi:2'-5' RNA ligase